MADRPRLVWRLSGRLGWLWSRAWMRWSGWRGPGRVATRLAAWPAPPYKARLYLAWLTERGFVSPRATIHHAGLRVGKHVFVGDGVLIYQDGDGGPVELDEGAMLFDGCMLETGKGGSIRVGAHSRVHRGAHLIAYESAIRIGRDVGIAQNCALYSYNHGVAPGAPISAQPLQSAGPIVIDDGAWLGVGVIVLDGVRVGAGAVIGAGSVVVRDVPEGAVACGNPARIVRMRAGAARPQGIDGA